MQQALIPIRFVAALSALVLSHGLSPASEIVKDRTVLVDECKREAVRGHYRQLLTAETLQHKQRMAAICGAWMDVREGEGAQMLTECLAEAQRGPLYGRGGRLDRGHVVKLREVCRSLYKA